MPPSSEERGGGMSEHRLEAMLARYPRAAEVQVESSDLRALLTELRRLREIERLLVAGASAALSDSHAESPVAYDCDGCNTLTMPFTNRHVEMRKVTTCPNCTPTAEEARQ
jgi:hypothetical protein